MSFRSLLIGVAIGILVGLYVAPYMGRPGFSPSAAVRAIDGLMATGRSMPPESSWPDETVAKRELFRFSEWHVDAQTDESTVDVKKCIFIGNDLACELKLNLAWARGDRTAEAVFKGKPGQWRMVALKARN